MVETNPASGEEPLRTHVKRTTLLFPWLPILVAFNIVTLIIAGVISNLSFMITEINIIWWLWLLCLAASMTLLACRLWNPARLWMDSEGIEYQHGSLRAVFRWNELSEITIADRQDGSRSRPAVCVLLVNGLGPEVLLAQNLSPTQRTPPFRGPSDGWIVLCDADRFTTPATDIYEAIERFAAGSGPQLQPR